MENGVLELRIPIRDRLTPSKFGKTLIVVDSGDTPTSIAIDGKLYVRVYSCVENQHNGGQNANLLSGPGMAEALAEPEAVLASRERSMDGLQGLCRQFWSSLKERARARTGLLVNRQP